MYPRIIIDKKKILTNAKRLKYLGKKNGVNITAIVKALSGHEIIRDIVDLGFERIGDSNLDHIQTYRDLLIEKWFLRNPIRSEISQLVYLTSGALISESFVLRAINIEAAKQGKFYQVILMIELGDLREGCSEEELISLAYLADSLPNIRLVGLGTNLSCFGNILPDNNNMMQLARLVIQVENNLKKSLPLISGGNSSSYLMLRDKELPTEINDLRFGEAMLLGRLPCYDLPIDELYQQTFIVETEIFELKSKPSLPWGLSGKSDSFGGKNIYIDKGKRLRALAALGKQQIHINGLQPLDAGVEILGGSSDCLVCYITDSLKTYKLGDKISFVCDYAALATGMSSNYIEKVYK